MTDNTEFGLTEVGQIAMSVQDLEAATAFYRDVLGMPFLFQAPGMSFFQCGRIRVMLGQPETPQSGNPSSIIYYRVEDVRPAYETLKARGVQFEHEPLLVHKTEDQELWMAFFRDPDRNLLALMSEGPLQTGA
ncbi:MAG: hypothetical protein AMS21_07400 [Gemmatimonas sp. SG8_38_2]|nr:MAG: hypothetical protein AMS21_07400 [Gemmatimonas sp. SG8_38_2]